MASEGKQKTFVLRIDARRMEAIEKWAADEFRSVNGQLLYIIDQALKKNRRWKETEEKVAEKNE
ncbi:MAG TPA: Arc family DNA-binding protein [Candidatus Alistipes merdigallinarum]|nr:Arc family DNA-binding protein [Candidatus Alistipes merdigallinarum]